VDNTPPLGFVLRYVPDVEAARHFYVDVLGLKVERYHPTFVQFAGFAVASGESLTGGHEPELYWLVDDAEASFRELSTRAEVSLELTRKPFGKVFGIRDPSGQICYVLELSRERPSVAVT
jgi:catechol 2,3-dioxygenase-like lactoylglutathione lyase family enzyme